MKSSMYYCLVIATALFLAYYFIIFLFFHTVFSKLIIKENVESLVEKLENNLVTPIPPWKRPMKNKNMSYRGELSSMDGIGFNFRNFDTSPFPKFYELEQLPECNLSFDKLNPKTTSEKILKGFHDCIDPIFENHLNKLNITSFTFEICEAIKKCDDIAEFQDLAIDQFKNDHEIKWAILPNCKEENVMVTMGIGHDVKAEVLLHRTLPNTKFYGADPIIEPNLQLYSTFGKFFPFAIGNQAGMNRFRVLPNQNQKTRQYTYQDVTTIDISYFLKNITNLTRIDFLWLDIEGGELTFLDFFHKGKQLDEAGITICQFNIEIHADYFENGFQTVYNFMNQVHRENKYVFLKPMETGKGVFRLFFINVEDQQCVRKFLQ